MANGARFFFGLPEPNEILDTTFANSPSFPFTFADIKAIVICSHLSGLGIPNVIDLDRIRTRIDDSLPNEFGYFEDESCIVIHQKSIS